MSEPKTSNLGLNKIDRSSPSTTYFDLDKYLDQNWEKIDGFTEQVEDKADETAAKVNGIQKRLDVAERATITLQPGLHVANANQNAAFKLAGLQGWTVLNYQSQIGIYGVLNPYVIRYGANLLPPFYEWEISTPNGSHKLASPYTISITNTSTTGGQYARYYVSVAIGQTYTLSLTISDTGIPESCYMYACDANKQRLGNKITNRSFTVPAGTSYVEVVVNTVDANGAVIGLFTFANPMLNIGSAALPFTQREDSMLALQTELHANPDNGANPDTVFERDGQYFKLAKWKRVAVNESLTYRFLNNYIGFKRVTIPTGQLPAPSLTVPQISWGTKYNGSLLKTLDTSVYPDSHDFSSSLGWLISISNADSGWGDSYTPTADEIKAYFLGWKMAENVTGFPAYNGSGVKCWFGIKSLSAPTTTLPTLPDVGYTPYQLLYQHATPVVEPITSEGQLTFIDGDNQVEVGAGIVLREGAKIISDGTNYFINSNTLGSQLSHRTAKILALYLGGRVINNAEFQANANAYGLYQIKILPQNLNRTEPYSVTYLMLDKYPAADFTGTYSENEKALLLDTVKALQDNTTRISVLESKKSEKDAPAWITPTLLNGWVAYETNVGGYPSARFFKDSAGLVHVDGLIKDGVVSASLPAFRLPVGFRPKQVITCVSVSRYVNDEIISRVRINPNGDVVFNNGGNVFFSLVIPPFLAEQ